MCSRKNLVVLGLEHHERNELYDWIGAKFPELAESRDCRWSISELWVYQVTKLQEKFIRKRAGVNAHCFEPVPQEMRMPPLLNILRMPRSTLKALATLHEISRKKDYDALRRALRSIKERQQNGGVFTGRRIILPASFEGNSFIVEYQFKGLDGYLELQKREPTFPGGDLPPEFLQKARDLRISIEGLSDRS